MKMTKKDLADQLDAYLSRRINLHVLAKWAKDAMMESEFEESDFELLRDVLSRIGLANVDGFSLRREEYKNFLRRLDA